MDHAQEIQIKRYTCIQMEMPRLNKINTVRKVNYRGWSLAIETNEQIIIQDDTD